MRKAALLAILSLVTTAELAGVAAFAQCDLTGSPITTIRDPLIDGATSTAPFTVAPEGQPPPMGQGTVPPPVNPGMTPLGAPTLIPTVPILPANDIEYPSYRIDWDPANLSAPGEVGPSIAVPPPPSTPGNDPGMLPGPIDFHPPPARIVNINPGGGIPGPIPTQRWGAQQTHDYGLARTNGTSTVDNGTEEQGNDTYDGGAHALPTATDTQDLYGNRWPLRPTVAMPNLTGTPPTNTATNLIDNASIDTVNNTQANYGGGTNTQTGVTQFTMQTGNTVTNLPINETATPLPGNMTMTDTQN